MNFLNEELQESFLKKAANKNLKQSFIALGLLILSAVIFFIAVDSFYPGHSDILSQLLIILFYGLMFLAVIVAIMTLVSSFKTIRKSKDNKNYIAIGIAILVLLAGIYEIFQRII